MNPDLETGNVSASDNSTMTLSTHGNLSNSTQEMAVPEGCVVFPFSGFLPWDNPDNLISQRLLMIIDKIVAIGVVNILYLISGPTNILNMIVFAKQGLKDRINLCIFVQSLSDFCYMTTNFLYEVDMLYLILRPGAGQRPLARFIMNNYLTGFYGFYGTSSFMTVIIASERCLCVLSPFRAQRILRTRTMLIIILVASVVILGCFFLVGTRWSVACVYDPTTGLTFSEIVPGKFYLLHKQLIDALDGYVYGVFLPAFCTLAVIVATVITVVKLKEITSWRETTSTVTSSVRDVALTRMLVGCSCLFIVCTLPVVVSRVWLLFSPDFSLGGRYHNTFTVILRVVIVFTCANSSCNFFIYYNVGTKYKNTLMSLCGKRKSTGTITQTATEKA